MDRYKVNPSYKKKTVIPKYVWITCGTGNYTNEKSAEFIAKKNAGINDLYYDQVSDVKNGPFTICSKEELLKHAHGNKLYMYGTMGFGELGDKISGCISCISLPTWGAVSYGMSSDVSTDRVRHSILKELCYEYEKETSGTMPQPTELVSSVSCDEDHSYCILVAAMIVE